MHQQCYKEQKYETEMCHQKLLYVTLFVHSVRKALP